MRLIDADELKDRVIRQECISCSATYTYAENRCKACDTADFLRMLEDMPTVEAQPVKSGRWNFIGKWENTYQCSECLEEFNVEGNPIENMMRYCPYCGVRMDGDSDAL